MENRRFYGRWVGFVEIMIPGFSTAALERLLPTLDLSDTGWGWGLDSLWPKLLDYRNVGIIDGTPVVHTRPVGQMRDPELGRRVLEESDRILTASDCRQAHTTFGAFGADLKRLDLSPEQLLAEMIEGFDYLIERDPRVLDWIAAFQQEPVGLARVPDGRHARCRHCFAASAPWRSAAADGGGHGRVVPGERPRDRRAADFWRLRQMRWPSRRLTTSSSTSARS